jgi:fatty acid desaturase
MERGTTPRPDDDRKRRSRRRVAVGIGAFLAITFACLWAGAPDHGLRFLPWILLALCVLVHALGHRARRAP